MTERNDAYWDELGVAWCAINPQAGVIAPRLKAQLRRQSFVITSGLVAGFILGGASLLLGLYTIWSGWETGAWNFVVRGIAIIAVAMIVFTGVLRLLPVRADDAASALSEMIRLSITRAQRTIQVIRLGLYACAVAAVLGIAGTAVRTYFASPPRVSPIIDLAILAAVALGLLAYGRYINDHLKRMRALERALAVDAEA